MIASPVPLDGRNKGPVSLVGEPSWFALTPGGFFAVDGGSFVFDKLDFRGSYGPEGAILLVSPESNVLVHDAILENMNQSLDRITWVRFQRSRTPTRRGLRFACGAELCRLRSLGASHPEWVGSRPSTPGAAREALQAPSSCPNRAESSQFQAFNTGSEWKFPYLEKCAACP